MTICGCRRCIERDKTLTELAPGVFVPAVGLFVVCVSCGNKRCPHATDHTFACTGSNEPGQLGSDYQ